MTEYPHGDTVCAGCHACQPERFPNTSAAACGCRVCNPQRTWNPGDGYPLPPVEPLVERQPLRATADNIERLRGAYRHVRDALEAMPCTNPRGNCEDLDAAGEIEDPEDWCPRCAALGNANDLLIASVTS